MFHRATIVRSFRCLILGLAALFAGSADMAAHAYPVPATIPFRWELEFEPGDLRLWVDGVDGQYYWFFTYKVVNRTGRDQIWAPAFTLFTDTGQILQSGRGVPPHVTQELLRIMGNEFLEPQNRIIGDILQGEEHAREGLVIWPADDLTVNEIVLFVGGLSGETARVSNPVTGEELILRKTMERSYIARGNAASRGTKPLELQSERWIMR